jgi:hypothetical protein
MSNLADKFSINGQQATQPMPIKNATREGGARTQPSSSQPFLQRQEFKRRRHENSCFKCASADHNALQCRKQVPPKVNTVNNFSTDDESRFGTENAEEETDVSSDKCKLETGEHEPKINMIRHTNDHSIHARVRFGKGKEFFDAIRDTGAECNVINRVYEQYLTIQSCVLFKAT